MNLLSHHLRRSAVWRSCTAAYLTVCFVLCAFVWVATAQATEEESRTPKVRDLRFDPARPETGKKLLVRMNLHNAARAEISWSKNGEDIGLADFSGMADYITFPQAIKSGDTIKATVTPFNEFGQAGETSDIEVVCQNAPPSISLLDQSLDGELYKARVKAEDPDGGAVTLTLVEGPQGLNLDPNGNITWKFAKGASGSFPVKVSAKDERGAEAILSYTIGIRQQIGPAGRR
jgi:hypothetical protein